MLVDTVDGLRPAGQLRVGDLVWSVDPATGRRLAVRVVLVRMARRECLALALAHAHGKLVCTPDHPLYSPERVADRPASDWISGDARTLPVIDGHGAREAPVRARAVHAGTCTVIDVSVDGDLHNFVAAGVVVHNKSFAYTTAIEEGPTFELVQLAGVLGERAAELLVGPPPVARRAGILPTCCCQLPDRPRPSAASRRRTPAPGFRAKRAGAHASVIHRIFSIVLA